MTKKTFIENRKRFTEKMKPDSLFVIFAGSAPAKRGDEFYDFAPQRNFYYMTGIDAPSVIFSIYKNGEGKTVETLFLSRYDEVRAKWDGAVLGREKAEEISGVESYKYTDEFHDYAATLFVRWNIKTVYADMENRSFAGAVSPDLEFVGLVRQSFPYLETVNAYPVFTELRLIKSGDEAGMISKALEITNEAFLAMLSGVKPGMMEYEVEAHFDYIIKKRGCRDRAFATILAAGKNATVLHYRENNSQIKDGDLVLADFGAQWGWYSADITRTFPANGKFTERQKQLYNIVLEGNKRIIAMVAPGVPFKALNEALKDYYFEELKKIGLVESMDEVSKYYYHGVSHMLGLETHDIGRGSEAVLKEGMVLTVEPGLYIAEENIGIRIEDDVLVTVGGCEVLSAGVIKTVEEIEAYMA